jgi:cell division protein FtsB
MVRYAEFVVPLVQSVQEQQKMIELLKAQNETLMKRIEKLESKL